MLIFAFIVLSMNPFKVDPKYHNAISNSKIALYKQSGLEEDVSKVKDGTSKKVFKWLRDNHLESPAAVAAFVAPIIINKEATITFNNFELKANDSKKQIIWATSF